VRKSIATIAVLIASATLVLGVTTPKRPAYCPLPENVTFDRTQHPEIIGLYTGKWIPTVGPFYIRKFCILLTSIRGNEVRGVYSWEAGGWGGQSGWRELDTASSSPFSTIEFSTVQSGDWRGINELKQEEKSNGNLHVDWQGFSGAASPNRVAIPTSEG